MAGLMGYLAAMDQSSATRFRRLYVFGIALAVAAAVLSGCGGGDGTDAADEPVEAADEPDATTTTDAPTAVMADEPDDESDETTDESAETTADVPAALAEPVGVVGVSDERVLFGQSAAFSGPAQQLGTEMKLGIQACVP